MVDHVVNKASEAVQGLTNGGSSGNKKLDQLQKEALVDHTQPDDKRVYTSSWGTALSNNVSWERAGPRGPSLLEDAFARDKIHHFDHERIPERVVHARGAGFHGIYECTNPLPKELTAAEMFNTKGATVPLFTRFSTVLGNRGSADTVRDVRGFAVKFYTDQGNFDIVGNDIPVFFHHDAMRFVDLIHAGKPEPETDIPQAKTAHNNFWDWVSLTPESSLMMLYVLSDYAIPRNYNNLNGHGVNTYKFVGETGEEKYVKFHWLPETGWKQHVWDEALKLQGHDTDFHRRHLNEMLTAGFQPRWKFYVQVMDPADEDNFSWDPLDATKLWPQSLYPMREVGEFKLTKSNDEFFAESENVAYCTSHVIPGIDFSDDPLLQGRNFSYNDTQTTRLGTQNYNDIPINRSVAPVAHHNRESYVPLHITKGPNYYPNRQHVINDLAEPATKIPGGPNHVGDGEVTELPGQISYNASQYLPASKTGRVSHQHGTHMGSLSREERQMLIKTRTQGAKFANYYEHAQAFYNSMSDVEKDHIKSAICFELGHCNDPIIHQRMVERFAHVNLDLAHFTAEHFGVKAPTQAAIEITSQQLPELSINKNNPRRLVGFRVALLLLPGIEPDSVKALQGALMENGCMPVPVGIRRGPVEGIETAHTIETCRSTMFDAVIVPVSSQDTLKTASTLGRARYFITESLGHLKPIAVYGQHATELVEKAIRQEIPEIEVAKSGSKDILDSYGVISTNSNLEDLQSFIQAFTERCKEHRAWDRPGIERLAY